MRGRLADRYEETIYRTLSDAPATPNEIAKLSVTHKTAKDALTHLALTRKDVRYKSSGRIHIFWREKNE